MASPLLRPSVVAATGLVGGFAVANRVKRRDVGGALFGLAGIWCAREWARSKGAVPAAALTAGYVGAMGVSHPLSRKLGPWPSVALVTAAVVVGSEAVRGARSA